MRGRVRFDHSAEILVARETGPLGFERDVTLRSVVRDRIATTWGELELAREARISERLEHPAIVRVIELFTEGDRLVLAVEGAETVTLDELLARNAQLSDDACAYVLATIASALAYAHGRSVIHRAVDPTTVVVDEDGTVKLTSFGVARMLESTADSAVTLLNARSREPSPEEASGAPPTEKTDVWSLGVLAVQLFARGKRAAATTPRLSALRPDLPREACAIVDAALQTTISCADFAKWIDRIFDADVGKRDLAEHVELHFEATPELSAAPRLSRTIRRQEASRRRLRGVREPLDVTELVEEIEPLPSERPPPVETQPLRRPAPALQRIEPLRAALPLEPVILVAPPPTPRVLARPQRINTGAFARVPSRLLLLAAIVFALAAIPARNRNPAIVPAAPAVPQPDSEPSLVGTACVPNDPHCAVDPKPQAVIPRPARKLPDQFGWAHVHSNGTVGQVFVAARAWGEPEKTIAVPCGRFYVNVARADAKGGWHGWVNIGRIVDVPCDGAVAEITLPRPGMATIAPPPPSAPAKLASTWPMSPRL